MKRVVVLLLLISMLGALLVSCGSQEGSVEKPQTTATITTSATDKTEPQILTEEEVKRFALVFCAGTTEDKVSDFSIKLTDHEERKCQVYEVSFAVGRIRYEYVFRATDCDIIVNNKTITETTVAK